MSRVIVFGADGFIGRHVVSELEPDHEVYSVSRKEADNKYKLKADLLDKGQIKDVIDYVAPHFIINCAGVVGPNGNVDNNPIFTSNIIEASSNSSELVSIIVSGSAAVYGGLLSESELPVKEDTPLRATQGYAMSKLEEESNAKTLANDIGVKLVILRIFNPIGLGMADKFLIPRLLEQVHKYEQGEISQIELSRLDSQRDYVGINDVARAFRAVVEGNPSYVEYNIGSGQGTSNGELLGLVVKSSKIKDKPRIVETQDDPEALVASCADISRALIDLGWKPLDSIEDIVEGIVDEKSN